MRFTRKPMAIGAPVALAIALLVLLAMWAWGGFGGGSSLAERTSLTGTLEYTVRDTDGIVKLHKVIPNTTTTGGLNAAASRLSVAQTVAATDVFENLQLCDVNNTADVCTTAQLVGDIKVAVAGAANNPAGAADTAVTGPGGVADGVGSYQVQDTFFCDTAGGGSCTKILKLELTAGNGTAGTADSTLAAFQAVDVTLADEDSIQVTWTIDID